MEPLHLQRDGEKSLHYQIYTEIKNQILRGHILPGTSLPSYRFMSRKYGVNISTVEKAYDMLEVNRYIQKRHGSGCYVLPLDSLEFYSDTVMLDSFEHGQSLSEGWIDFASSTPVVGIEESRSFAGLIQKLAQDKPEELLRRPPTRGIPALRDVICENFAQRGETVCPEHLHIINGCQQGINLICQSIISKNSVVLVDDPGYSVATNSFQRAGAQIETVSMEEDGPDLAALEGILSRIPVDYYYTMANFQCPTNVTFSPEKRAAILTLAEQHGFVIIEDDCLGELYFEGGQKSTLWNTKAHDQVIYLTSFSTCLAPGLRLGYMVVPERFERRITAAKFNADVATPAIMQEALALYIKQGLYERHIQTLRQDYARKRTLMRQMIEASRFLSLPYHNESGGAFFWVQLPENVESVELWSLLQRQNIKVIPSIACSQQAMKRHFIRLSYAGCDEEMIRTGMLQIQRETERLYLVPPRV